MKRIFLFLLLAVAAVDALAQHVDWNRPKYVMSCVMKPKPMVLDTIGMYEYHGDSVVIYHRLDMLRDPVIKKLLSKNEPFRTYKKFDTCGNITAEVLYYVDTTYTTKFTNTYDTLGRLVEVEQSDGLKKKYVYCKKKIKESIYIGKHKRNKIIHHYKNEDYTEEKYYVIRDIIDSQRMRYKYNKDGSVRKTLQPDGSTTTYLYKANCTFISELGSNPFYFNTKKRAIVYDWLDYEKDDEYVEEGAAEE